LTAHDAYAGFWRRFLAMLLDLFLLSLFIAIIRLFLVAVFGDTIQESMDNHRTILYSLWILVVPALTWFWYRFQATPGKMLMDCSIVNRRTGDRPGPGQCLLRCAAYLASILPLFLGFAWILWDKHKQGFHDRIAKTLVVTNDESRKPLKVLMREIR
jgi:uncharacterized RDD family membrane protein YckC